METSKRDGAPAAFDVGAHGLDLLKLFSDLIMQASSDLWVSSGLFLTSNGVLLVALFTQANIGLWTEVTLGVFGILLAFAWRAARLWATGRVRAWAKRAENLQDRIGIPKEFAVWGEKFYAGVKFTKTKAWISKVYDFDLVMLMVLNWAFVMLWALVLAAAGGQAGLWPFP